ncbi:MAG: hypothetical protein NVSMB47_21340 [Polyangiales bacterium]
MSLPTDRRVAVRVLLRGIPTSKGGELMVEGHKVFVLGEAQPAMWPRGKAQAGDIEGVVWTDPDGAGRVIGALRDNSCVAYVLEDA